MSRSYSHVFTLTIGAVEAQRPDECRCRSSHGVEAHNPKLFKRDIEPELTSEPGGQTKTEINPMNQRRLLQALHETPRCNARTRAGIPCQCPAIRGRKRCRLHGGLSPGAPRGNQNGNYTNGEWTAEAIEERRWLRSLVLAFAKNGTGP
jgi:hypothetical protein